MPCCNNMSKPLMVLNHLWLVGWACVRAKTIPSRSVQLPPSSFSVTTTCQSHHRCPAAWVRHLHADQRRARGDGQLDVVIAHLRVLDGCTVVVTRT